MKGDRDIGRVQDPSQSLEICLALCEVAVLPRPSLVLTSQAEGVGHTHYPVHSLLLGILPKAALEASLHICALHLTASILDLVFIDVCRGRQEGNQVGELGLN